MRDSDAVVRAALEAELARGGQVFFLHNRVATIGRVKTRLAEICPKARVVVAHGRMDAAALARKMAAKALRNHRNVMLEPMSAYERRIIHSEIQGIEGVATNSVGSDNNRKIVIYLTDAKKAAVEEPKDVEETVALTDEVLDTAEETTASPETDDATL